MRTVKLEERCSRCGRVRVAWPHLVSAHVVYERAEEETAATRREGREPCDGCVEAVEQLAGRVTAWRNARSRELARSLGIRAGGAEHA